MNDELLTPSQAAHLLKISVSSLRRYAADFADHLSPSASTTERKRFYTHSDLALLARARDLLRSHSASEVKKLLSSEVIDDKAQPPAVVNVALPAIADELNHARDLIMELSNELEKMKQERAGDAEKITELAKRLEALERRSWWDMLRGKK